MDILNNYKDYCDYDNFHNPANRKSFQELWTNVKFIDCFTHTLEINDQLYNTVRNNSYFRTGICKITYDYYHDIGRLKPDDIITTKLLQLVKYINKKEVLILSSFMHEKAANFIALAAYSSFKSEICMRRVNSFILKLGYDFSTKDIINIYSQFYLNNFGSLFNYTMTDIIDMNRLNDNSKKMYNNQNTAILTILESMPSYEMRNVLDGYWNYLEYDKDKRLRFNIYDLREEDFPRIKKILSE
jgi:hypothetical protein